MPAERNESRSPILKEKQEGMVAVRAAVKRGDLEKPAQCEGCDRVVEVFAHHDDYSKPLDVNWLCRDCHAAEHKTEPPWVIAARELRATGKTYAEIAGLLDRSESSVWKRLNPEKATAINRRSNAGRRAKKREWENKRKRSPEYRGACQGCGGLMGIGTPYDGMCHECQPRGMTGAIEAEGRLVERWWNEGLSMTEIAGRLGKTKGSLGGMMDYWRGKGFNMPYRRSGKTLGVKFGHLQKKASDGPG